jgi:cytochrome b561
MLTKIIHWLVVIALALQLYSCIFMGQSNMPGVGF